MTTNSPLAIYYEHPEWFKPLFAELERRGVSYDEQLAYAHRFDPLARTSPYTLIINRMSPSAYLRGNGHAIWYTGQYLAYLHEIGANVLNNYTSYCYEFSKARQLGLFEQLGLPYPRSRVINHASQALEAAQGMAFPVIVKANIGGSGAGIRKFDSAAELEAAVAEGEIDLGLDHTALVQEFLPARGNSIIRVEVLNGRYLYAIRVHLADTGGFNLCPADYCDIVEEAQTNGSTAAPVNAKAMIEGYTPPAEAISAVERIIQQAHIDVGGVEYLVNDRDGQIYYYDVNALSNFVADAVNVIGFDPFPRLVDFILAKAESANVG